MDQSVVELVDGNVALGQWCLDETDLIEHKRQALCSEKREIERERRKLEREKQEFFMTKRSEDRRKEEEKQLFEMKWRILEEELKKLAEEKAQVEKQRKFYKYVSDYETTAKQEQTAIVRGDMFFVGVEDKQSLKKRYKDLIKIYHPDNRAGDIGTIQEINREYDKLQARYM